MKATVADARHKRKSLRGRVRERRWTGTAGQIKTAWQADFGTVNGKRLMRSFTTKAEAETWLHAQRLMLEDQGHAAFAMTDAQRIDATKAMDLLREVDGLPVNAPLEHVAKTFRECLDLLKGTGRSLHEAARFMVKHAPKAGALRSVTEAVAEYVRDARENNLRPRSISSIEHRLAKLVARFGERPIAEITRADADAWLRSDTIPLASRKHFRVIAHGLFNFAIDREYYAAENPFTAKRHKRQLKGDETMPECLPWRDVEAVMQAAAEEHACMVPALAIGFFAGLRSNELAGLDWRDIDLSAGRITVMPHVAKKRRARHVAIEDNLLAWLLPYRKTEGPVAPTAGTWRIHLDAIREKIDIKWPHNAMRHSFASHHLAKHGDTAKTAFQLGHHRDTTMLFEHYRALVTKEDGSAYFNIRPTVAESGVIPFKATA